MVASATKGGMHFLAHRAVVWFFHGRSPVVWFSPPKGGIYTGALGGAVPRQRSGAITPLGESPEPVREASAGPGQNPGSPGPEARRLPQPSRRSRVNLREYSFPPIPSQKPAATIVAHSKKALTLPPKGGIKNGAHKGAHLASAAVLHTSRGRSPQPVREASAGPGRNPWRPGPSGPAAPSTLARRASTFRNTAEHRIIPKSPISQMIRTAKKH